MENSRLSLIDSMINVDNQLRVGLCIPTLNAAPHIPSLLKALASQTLKLDTLLVIDSESSDGTREIFEEYGAEVKSIKKKDFDHGGTRQIAVELLGDVEIVLFMTQDALPADSSSLEALVELFGRDDIAAAYGRQLPRPGARAVEAHARVFNYPENGRVKSMKNVSNLGIMTAFISNSFAAYRKSSLVSVGGFPREIIFGEDMYVAARLLLGGWKIAYAAEARVFHSHHYSHAEEFRRYFDIGVFLQQNEWIGENFGGANRNGLRFLWSEIQHLAATDAQLLPQVFPRGIMKLLGSQLGRRYRIIPRSLRKYLSMNGSYWD